MFNKDQLANMKWLSEQPPETLCQCGWYKKNECANYHGCEDGQRIAANKSLDSDAKEPAQVS